MTPASPRQSSLDACFQDGCLGRGVQGRQSLGKGMHLLVAWSHVDVGNVGTHILRILSDM